MFFLLLSMFYYFIVYLSSGWLVSDRKASKAKQRCVMSVGMCLYAQLVQTKNKSAKVQL